MREIKKILVSLPPIAESMALQRARQLALKLDASLDLLVMDPLLEQSGFLEQQLANLHDLGIRAFGKQVPVSADHASDTILEAAARLDSDLLIKQHSRESWLKKHLHLPDDWRLARGSRVPLLLVQGQQTWTAVSVLVAMDVEHHDEPHHALHGNVMYYASELCTLFGSRLHVVSAYKPVSQSNGVAFAEFDRSMAGPFVANPHTAYSHSRSSVFSMLNQGQAQHCRDQCQWFALEYELADKQIHLGAGPASEVIPAVAGQVNAALVVLGTVARHGLFGALMGNAVESLLDHLDCDVLVLQPHIACALRQELCRDDADISKPERGWAGA